jgi:hypothetical protein
MWCRFRRCSRGDHDEGGHRLGACGGACRGRDRWLTVTLDLDLETMNCTEGEPTSSDLAELQAVWVWIDGTGSFWIDNVRAE